MTTPEPTLSDIVAALAQIHEEMATKRDLVEIRQEITQMRREMATKQDLLNFQRNINTQFQGFADQVRLDLRELEGSVAANTADLALVRADLARLRAELAQLRALMTAHPNGEQET